MKIILIGTRGVPANYGGFETYADKLSENLAKSGNTITVTSPHYRSSVGNIWKNVNIKYIFDPEIYFNNRYIKGASTLLHDALSILHSCIGKYDIVLICGYVSGPLMLLPLIFGKKVVINPDGFEWKSARWGPIIRSWLHLCEFISAKFLSGMVADSPEIGRYFKSKFNNSPAVIPYGADVYVDLPFPSVINSDIKYYLAIARMVPETNIPMIIDGFLNSKSKDKLYIVGPIKDSIYFKREIESRLKDERIEYLGAIYEPGMVPSLRFHAKALLHGHASDGTNPSLIESMGTGSIVLAIDRPSNREPLGDQDVYFKDSAELANKIDYIESLSDPMRKIIMDRNREEIRNNYSWKMRTMQHIDYFRRLLDEV